MHKIVPPISRDILNRRNPTTIKQYLTNNAVQISNIQNTSTSEQSLNIQTDENYKHKKKEIQTPILKKMQRNDNSIQEIKTIKRLLQYNNKKYINGLCTETTPIDRTLQQ